MCTCADSACCGRLVSAVTRGRVSHRAVSRAAADRLAVAVTEAKGTDRGEEQHLIRKIFFLLRI
jgi:hypothetical protein